MTRLRTERRASTKANTSRAVALAVVVGGSVSVAVGSLLVTSSARATFPGENGLLAAVEGSVIDDGCCGGGAEAQYNTELKLFSPRSGREVRRLSSCVRPECFDEQPAWSADGRWLAFIRSEVVYAMRSDGSDVRRIAPGRSAAWSPDGRRLVVERLIGGDSRSNLFTVRRDGSGSRRLTGRGGFEPAWGSNGRIAFARPPRRPGPADIYTVRADGRGLRRLTRRGFRFPDWSPGATKLVVESDFGTRPRGVFVITARGRILGRVARGGALGRFPVWSPDGRKIAFDRGADAYVTTASTAPRRRVARRVCRLCGDVDWQPLPR